MIGDNKRPAISESTATASSWQGAVLVCTAVCGVLPLMIGPVLPKLATVFSAAPYRELLVPFIVTLPAAILAILGPFIGALADRIGKKRLLIMSLILYGLAGTAPLYLQSLYFILATRAVVGIAEAGAMASSTGLIGDLFADSRRERYISLHTSFASFSAMLLNLAGGYLGTMGWRAPFLIYVIPLFLVPFSYFLLPSGTARRKFAAPAHADHAAHASFVWPCILVAAFLAGLAMMTMPLNLSFLAVERGISDSRTIGQMYAVMTIGVIFGSLGFGWLIAPRLQNIGRFALAAVAIALGCLTIGLTHSTGPLVIGSFLTSVGCGLLLPATAGWAIKTTSPANRSLAMGIFFSSQFLGQFASPIVTYLLGQFAGPRTATIFVLGLIACAIAIGLCTLGTVRRNRHLAVDL